MPFEIFFELTCEDEYLAEHDLEQNSEYGYCVSFHENSLLQNLQILIFEKFYSISAFLFCNLFSLI
jgi:hypothetical protein